MSKTRRLLWGLSVVLAVCASLSSLGCPSYTLLSVKDQEAIQSKQVKQEYFLKLSMFHGPFFVYDDRTYLSERANDERVLIESPGGDPILPGESQGVLPMGTKVTIREIEFPSSGAIASRKLKSPRHFTWVMLDVDGRPAEKPFVLVLTPEFTAVSQFEKSLGEYLVKEDPRPAFAGRPPEELQAIDQKTLWKGMRADSLQRSRGFPDRVKRAFEGGTKVERWQYAKAREVVLKEDVVDSWEGFPVSAPPPAAPPPATP